MSQRDLPLWARALAAALLIIASWWLVETETLRVAVGDSITLLSLGIIAVSILQGMHLPLGLWPRGPWRRQFSKSVVSAVAVAFGLCFVVFDPGSSRVVDGIDIGVFILVVLGVVAWGFSWALVRQRSFARWYAVATVAALVPLVGGVIGLQMRGGDYGGVCLWLAREGAEGAVCDAPALRTLGFMTAVYAAVSLVTLELTFRRVLIGEPTRGGLALVAMASIPYGLWLVLVTPSTAGLDGPLWLGMVGAVTAGCLYVLSESLLVSALYTGATLAGYEAIVRSVPETLSAPRPEFTVLHAIVAATLAVWVWRHRGLVSGLR